MAFTFLEIWIGLFMVIALVALAIKTSKKSKLSSDDNKVLKAVQETLDADNIEHYEISSIMPLDETSITTVIVHTDSVDIALEIDKISGKVIHKEKLIR